MYDAIKGKPDSDPVVATIFAINGKNFEKGILQVALPKKLQGA
jgi:hypothetical protein